MLELSTGAHKNIIEKTVTYQNKKKGTEKKKKPEMFILKQGSGRARQRERMKEIAKIAI